MTLEYCARCGARLRKSPPCQCEVCDEAFWDNPRPCGGAFVTHAGRLLLVQRQHEPWACHWDVPGGFCDGGEHPEDAAIREVHEETGLAIVPTGLLGMWIDRYGDDGPWTLNIYFNAYADDPSLARAADETLAVRWFSPEELVGLPLAFPDHLAQALVVWESTRLVGQAARRNTSW